MLTMFEKIHNVYVSVILFLVLKLQTCYGQYTCYQMLSGNDICFLFDNSTQNFEDSKLFCQNNGGFLLEIYNEEMERLVEQFAKSKFLTFVEVWLNLVRTNKVWFWGGEGSNKILNYSNWEGGIPASYEGSPNHAFMKSYYKWSNAYEMHNASKICIRGNSGSYWFSFTCYQMSSGKEICFMFDNSTQNFEDSKLFCQKNGGFLLEIYNEEMERLVEQFAQSKFLTFVEVWLNLVRTNGVWFWGGDGSDRTLNYSNWEGGTPASYDGSPNHAFMKSYYKWSNAYEIQSAAKICILGNSESYWFRPDTTSTTTTVRSVPATDKATTRIKATKMDSSKVTTNSIVSSLYISETAATAINKVQLTLATTNTILSQNTTTGFKIPAASNSNSAGVGMGLGTFVLIIVSSLLIAKFDFDKEIPLPVKSSRSRKSPPHETGTDRSLHANLHQTRSSTGLVSKT